MNRKAQFFALTGVLLIIILVVIFRSSVSVVEEQERFRVARAQAGVMDSFARNFATVEIPKMLETYARLGLQAQTRDDPGLGMSYAEFSSLMRTGRIGARTYLPAQLTTNAEFGRVQSTLGFADNEPMTFTYVVTDIDQVTPRRMRISFLVTYDIVSEGSRWRAADEPYTVELQVEGITHPDPGDTGIPLRILDSWQPYNSGSCVVEHIFGAPCGGVLDLVYLGFTPPAT